MDGSAYIDGKEYEVFNSLDTTHPFTHNGLKWNSTEEAYESVQFIKKIKSTLEHTKELTSCYNKTIVRISHDIIKARIEQHTDLIKLLLSTRECEITFPDSDEFWGTGGVSDKFPYNNLDGNNFNGKNLMDIRRALITRLS
jgi:predicted NAD-dependent protein-ADP-ribosyltransferase YbiA (DUF1768 family)